MLDMLLFILVIIGALTNDWDVHHHMKLTNPLLSGSLTFLHIDWVTLPTVKHEAIWKLIILHKRNIPRDVEHLKRYKQLRGYLQWNKGWKMREEKHTHEKKDV